MTWVFLPAFAALVALAVPVLVHLARAAAQRGEDFPSLVFLRQIKVKQARFSRLRDPLLLFLRCLALIAVVLAFAQPVTPDDETGSALVESPALLLIDRSASMSQRGDWEATLRTAANVLSQLSPRRPIAIGTFDDKLSIVTSFEDTREVAARTLSALTPSDGRGALNAAVESAAAILSGHEAGGGELWVFSDFQAQRTDTAARVARSVTVHPVVSPTANTKAAVLGATLTQLDVTRLRLDVTVYAPMGTAGVPLRIEVGGAQFKRIDLDDSLLQQVVSANIAQATDRDIPFTLQLESNTPRWSGVIPAMRPRNVLVLNELNARDALFVTRALAVGGTRQVRVHGPGDGRPLSEMDVIVGPRAAVDAREAIRNFVRRGGATITVPSGEAHATSDRKGERKGAGESTFVSRVDKFHPMYQALSADDGGAFMIRPVWRYRENAVSDASRPIALYANGHVALVETQVGAGTSIAFSTAWSPPWSELGLDARFAPLMVELVKYLAPRAERSTAYNIGDPLDVVSLSPTGSVTGANSPARQTITIQSPMGTVTERHPGDPISILRETGLHTIRSGVGLPRVLVAANIPAIEWTGPMWHAEDWKRTLVMSETSASAAAAISTSETPDRHSWSMLLLLVALAVIFLEAFLANKLTVQRGSV